MKSFFTVSLALLSTTVFAQQDPAQTFMSSLDQNRDGKVSQEEFLKPSIKEFSKIDSNGDGGIDTTEAEAYIEGMRVMLEQRMRHRKAPAK